MVQFFNTAFLMMLANANMSEQTFDFFLTKGKLPDFNARWFQNIGNTLVATMIFTAYFPLLEFFGFFAMRTTFRILDSGINCSRYSTKKTAIQPYIDAYAGPVYFLHYKYSGALNICFVTMMYGFGMPILFPIACCAFIVMCFVEKTMLFYSYRLPPMYDERLSKTVLKMLAWAPAFGLLFGYWMISNRQLLSNDNLTPVPTALSIPDVNHSYLSVFTPTGWSAPAWPLLFFGIYFVLRASFGPCMDR